MSLFFESIKLEDGQFFNLELHEKRMKNTVKNVFKKEISFDLKSEFNKLTFEISGLFKVKVMYDLGLKNISIEPYALKNHNKIILLDREELNYTYKNVIRKSLDFDKTVADDAIFIVRGSLSDATYSNIALHDGNEWFTPKKCLLKGVKREYLFENRKIKIRDIKIDEIEQFSKIAFINAMRDFEKTYTFVKEGKILHLQMT
jgi:4-amino-4-deoxychorismate lyase